MSRGSLAAGCRTRSRRAPPGPAGRMPQSRPPGCCRYFAAPPRWGNWRGRADRTSWSWVGRGGAGAALVLIKQVLEFGALPLEPGGVQVGDVVRDDFDVELLREHAGRGDIHRTHCLLSPSLPLGDLAELVDGGAGAIALAVTEVFGKAEIVRDVHHSGDLEDRLDVRPLDHALLHNCVGCRLRQGFRDEESGGGGNQITLVIEADDGEAAGLALVRRQCAVLRHGDVLRVGRHGQWAVAIGENRVTLSGHDLAGAVELKSAVTRVTNAE